MIVSPSKLKTWQSCPEAFRLKYVERLSEPRSAALSFGSIIHACIEILETSGLKAAIKAFNDWWRDPTLLDPELQIDYYLAGTSWKKYSVKGHSILKEWAAIWAWNTDVVFAREYSFEVPIGDGHTLRGIIDRLALRSVVGKPAVVVQDYKTSRKEPTFEYLEDDLQFISYCYATTRPEFWAGFSDGEERWRRYQGYARIGEWIQLLGPKVKSAGVKTQPQYNRLTKAVNQLALSVEAGIYVPTISGTSCKWCSHREICGLEPPGQTTDEDDVVDSATA